MELYNGTSKIKTFKFSHLVAKIKKILFDDLKKPALCNSPFRSTKNSDVKFKVLTQVQASNAGDSIQFTDKELVDLDERMKICTSLSDSTLLSRLEYNGFNNN